VRLAAEAAAEVKPDSVVRLDLRGLCSFTDFFLIVSAGSHKQVQAIADKIAERLRSASARPLHIEGYAEARWILLDYNECIIHIFEETTRQYYDLERLWGDAPRSVLVVPDRGRTDRWGVDG
jgi:ribosome-associated protein